MILWVGGLIQANFDLNIDVWWRVEKVWVRCIHLGGMQECTLQALEVII